MQNPLPQPVQKPLPQPVHNPLQQPVHDTVPHPVEVTVRHNEHKQQEQHVQETVMNPMNDNPIQQPVQQSVLKPVAQHAQPGFVNNFQSDSTMGGTLLDKQTVYVYNQVPGGEGHSRSGTSTMQEGRLYSEEERCTYFRISNPSRSSST